MTTLRELAAAMLLVGCVCDVATAAPKPGAYLYAWSGDADERDSDFLAVIDADPASPGYGEVVATAPIGVKATMPHHIEYETPPNTTLFANGWKSSHSFVLDITDPLKPRVKAEFKRAGDYLFPHSFARLPNGNVLATFQSIGNKYAPPGALVELDNEGRWSAPGVRAPPAFPTSSIGPTALL
jgi:hypothetical protein